MQPAGLTLRLEDDSIAPPQRLLYELISQYPILSAIATELSIDDILNFGLTSKDTWSCIASAVEEEKLAKSVTQQALQCSGLCIQISAGNDDAYLLPCTKKRGVEVRRCQGCGVGVCETCRFRVSHGTVLTMPKKQRWFFPSRTRSGSILVNDNMECLNSSFTHGHGAHQPMLNPCPCTYQARWLEKWLCVPCLNKDLWTPPVEKEVTEFISDAALETMTAQPVEVQ